MALRYQLTMLLPALLVVCGLLSACGSGDTRDEPRPSTTMTFIHDGLQGLTIHQLYQHHDQLFAATSNGIYVKTPGSGGWNIRGLANFQVTDIAFIDPSHFIASAQATTPHTAPAQLYETTTAGQQWLPLDAHTHLTPANNWRGLSYAREVNALYAISDNFLLTSLDSGRDWQALLPEQTANTDIPLFVIRHPVTGDIWSGGYNDQLQPWLQASSGDTGQTLITAVVGKTHGRVRHLSLDPERPATLLLSSDEGLWRSQDYGKQWDFLQAPPANRIYQTLLHDPLNANWVYTSSREMNNTGPQRLIFEMSQDRGTNWTRYYYPGSNLQGGTQSMLAITENNKTVIYLGLAGGGIVKINMP
jgi:hypothetical protein